MQTYATIAVQERVMTKPPAQALQRVSAAVNGCRELPDVSQMLEWGTRCLASAVGISISYALCVQNARLIGNVNRNGSNQNGGVGCD